MNVVSIIDQASYISAPGDNRPVDDPVETSGGESTNRRNLFHKLSISVRQTNHSRFSQEWVQDCGAAVQIL